MKEANIITQTKAWIERLVIGMNLCPFASTPFRKGQIRFRVIKGVQSSEQWSRILLNEGRLLLDPAQSTPIETTLLLLPQGWSDFAEYLGLVDALEQLILQAGWEGDMQIASFHPDYQFADSGVDDPANFTNRSPYPMIHLLREDRMAEALANYPTPEQIPEANVVRMRDLGKEQLEKLLDEIKKIDT